MAEKNELVVPQLPTLAPAHRSVMVTPAEWDCMKDQARMFLTAGCLPSNITKPEQAMVLIMKGRELGIPPMASLSSIFLIKGTPAISAQLMLALCYRDLRGFKFQLKQSTDTIARVEIQRPGGSPEIFAFSLEDAKRAQLLGRPDSNWAKYPQRMLLHRAISFACRTVCPDVVLGCYTPEEAEEIGRDVTPPEAKYERPRYLPGVEPKCTAEQYVKNLYGVPGGVEIIRGQILKFDGQGMTEWADELQDALRGKEDAK